MKMLKKKETEQRQAIEMPCMDMLAPQEHLLRKIDAAVDFSSRKSTLVRIANADERQVNEKTF